MIFDNARYHLSKVVSENLEQLGALFLTIPPYCPELNPVEHLINALKSKFKAEIAHKV